jgi:NAD(P)-dependent dehydrogenase (short-subunit alcohol dehydrogenase family)
MNVLITGVSRGVGLEISKLFLENGHTVYGISRTESEELKALEKQYPENLFLKHSICQIRKKSNRKFSKTLSKIKFQFTY